MKKHGADVYAAHPSTEVQCCAVKIDNGPCRVYAPERVVKTLVAAGLFQQIDYIALPEFLALIRGADEIHAHNCAFERAILRHTMRVALPPVERFRCTAAKAAAMALPRSLAGATGALGLSLQKDPAGYRLMLALCKPIAGKYRESAGDFLGLIRYCIQDVEAEFALDAILPDLSPSEQALWCLDQEINDRGFYVDRPCIAAIVAKVEEYTTALDIEAAGITGGVGATQVEASLRWLAAQGVQLIDMTVESVAGALERTTLAPGVRRFLEIRQAVSKSSVAKFYAMQRMAGADGRVRGTTLFCGATTRRWAGRGVQPHNFPRAVIKGPDKKPLTEAVLFAFAAGDIADVAKFAEPMAAASACLRPVIRAAPGRVLLCADFANIEGRVAAWLAQEDWKLAAFQALDEGRGDCLYRLAYARSFGVPVDTVTPDQRQIGKVQELSLQFQSWVGGFSAMAKAYGVEMSEERMAQVCAGWREAHPRIVSYWGHLEAAAIRAVETGSVYKVGRIAFGVRGNFIHARLPSGGLLAYAFPRVVMTERHGNAKKQLHFLAVDSYTNKWQESHTYGGCLFENMVQAIARDILAESMKRVAAAGFSIVLHVHDEIVAEIAEENGTEERLAEFCGLMRQTPAWAEGCPVEVKGWRGVRYRKD